MAQPNHKNPKSRELPPTGGRRYSFDDFLKEQVCKFQLTNMILINFAWKEKNVENILPLPSMDKDLYQY